MIQIDDNGNFTTDANNHLQTTRTPAVQNAKSELRCIQGSWDADPYFGRNQLIWTISQSTQDRALDINRIITKYATCISVVYDPLKKQYNAQVA